MSQRYYLAQFSISLAKASLDQPSMEGFVSQLPIINALADNSPGFVWRLQGDQGDSTDVRGYDNPDKLLNLSLWESIEALRNFVFRSAHDGPRRGSREWFEEMDKPVTALWWVPEGERPTAADGVYRLAYLASVGNTPFAFGFNKPFDPPSHTDSNTTDAALMSHHLQVAREDDRIVKAREEVIDLHQYFEQWFRGEVEKNDENTALLTQRFSDHCELITPDGVLNSKFALMNRLQQAYGQFPTIRIWIDDFMPLQLGDNGVLVRYREWRDIDGDVNCRYSTCLFKPSKRAPFGLSWFSIHETWAQSTVVEQYLKQRTLNQGDKKTAPVLDVTPSQPATSVTAETL